MEKDILNYNLFKLLLLIDLIDVIFKNSFVLTRRVSHTNVDPKKSCVAVTLSK